MGYLCGQDCFYNFYSKVHKLHVRYNGYKGTVQFTRNVINLAHLSEKWPEFRGITMAKGFPGHQDIFSTRLSMCWPYSTDATTATWHVAKSGPIGCTNTRVVEQHEGEGGGGDKSGRRERGKGEKVPTHADECSSRVIQGHLG